MPCPKRFWCKPTVLLFTQCISETIGICCAILSFIGPATIKNEHSRIRKRSIRPRPKKRVHISAHEVIHFPQDHHAKGVLSLPYGNIVEPFEAWYSAEHKMSRIDYYGGKAPLTTGGCGIVFVDNKS
jgi:hypothetical protein